MADTIRERVFLSVLAKLQGITGLDDFDGAGQVERNRRDPCRVFPFIVLRDGGHRVIERQTEEIERTMIDCDVEIFVRGDAPGTLINAVYGKVKAALMDFLRNPPAPQLIFDVQEREMTQPLLSLAPTDERHGQAAIVFDLETHINAFDPTALAP